MRLSAAFYAVAVAGLSSAASTETGGSPQIHARLHISTNNKHRTAAVAGGVIGAVVFLGLVVCSLIRRRRALSKRPVEKIVGIERGPDPDIDSSNLLDGDGQPADAADATSEMSSKREKKKKKGSPISAITGGIVQGASLAGDAVLGIQRRLFKRLTAESTTDAEMEMEPSTLVSEEPASSSPELPREGFFTKMARRTRENSTKSTGEIESQPSVPFTEEAANSPPEISRDGFFAKLARKPKKTSEPTTTFTDETGLTFQERLFKRPTLDAPTVDTPEIEMGPPVLSDEPVSVMDESRTEILEEDLLARKPKKKGTNFAGSGVLSFQQRLFKRTATETASLDDKVDADTESSPPFTVDSKISLSQDGSQPTQSNKSSAESAPKAGSFMLKLRHKFSKPDVVPDLETARNTDVAASAASESQNADKTDAAIMDSGSSSNLTRRMSRSTTNGHGSQPALIALSSHLNLEPTDFPPPFDTNMSNTHLASGSEPPARSFSTLKRDQTRAILGPPDTEDSNAYLASPSIDAPMPTRSLSTMKRDQTRAISRDQQHSATDVLVQTPGGLQLMPGQSRVVSTDESRAVASELRDLREYIRVLEADLAAGGRRTPGEYIPVQFAPPPSYEETS